MKLFRSILITIFCAAAILFISYIGIVMGGEQILKVSSEPEPVTMKGDISSLFYSKIEDDIQLYPWNYYPKEQNSTSGQQTSEQASGQEASGQQSSDQQSSFAGANVYTGPFEEYSLFLENDVFYTLIALAADVDPQEVSKWYGDQEKTIMMNMVQGQSENEPMDIYFYDEEIRLNGKQYRVQISCNGWSIISFSCIQQQEEGVKETEEWKKQKEILTRWMEDNPGGMELIYDRMYNMSHYYKDDWENFAWYVDFYQNYLEAIHNAIALETEESETESKKTENEKTEKTETDKTEKEKSEKGKTEKDSVEIYIQTDSYVKNNEGLQVQMIELKDSLLLVAESDITIGIYYDVLRQRVTGFHFFWD